MSSKRLNLTEEGNEQKTQSTTKTQTRQFALLRP
jgi:hypothetical protein